MTSEGGPYSTDQTLAQRAAGYSYQLTASKFFIRLVRREQLRREVSVLSIHDNERDVLLHLIYRAPSAGYGHLAEITRGEQFEKADVLSAYRLVVLFTKDKMPRQDVRQHVGFAEKQSHHKK